MIKVRDMTKRNRGIIVNNSGETMVEMIVSFTILAIVMLALGGMIYYSSVLRMRATDTSDVCSSFYQAIYKKTPDADQVDAYYYVGSHADDNTTMFKFVLSDDTDDDNLRDIRTKFTNAIKVPNIDATGYKSKDPLITSENLVTPRAVLFMYNGSVKSSSITGNTTGSGSGGNSEGN